MEQDYNTSLLHSNLAFPLLNILNEVRDSPARKALKDEVVKRIKNSYVSMIIYLMVSKFLDIFSQEEFDTLIEDIKKNEYVLNETTLDLICSFHVERSILSVIDLIFLIEHPKINLYELLIKFGKNFFEKDSNYIGEFIFQ
ncbi:hypothetical protein LCGC14_1041930 [marine sediment metagenome]|uniref:Uncharacterized protein n=1 Tax=marine sediment metagenome TaxID=412755 RepID=A0A0F9QXQ1_9ZZZZ